MRLGIDFGTCFSSAAFMDGENMIVVRDSTSADSSVPSSVFLTLPEKFDVGRTADNRRRQDPERYRNELKRDLGREDPLLQDFRAVDLIAQVLGKIKRDADTWAISKGRHAFTGAVLGIPTTYQENKRVLMHQAAKKAGFVPEEVTLVDEPVAAALYYMRENTVQDGERLLIYDLGGGTFDTAFIQKQDSNFINLALPTGIERCGGIDFDRSIYNDILKHYPILKDLLHPKTNGNDKQALLARRMLGELCIAIKHQLTHTDEIEEPIVLPGLEKPLYYTLTVANFNQMIERTLLETIACCKQMLQQANSTWEQVDRIILVGGSCHIPYVKKLLEKETKRSVSKALDLELLVCQGAARYAAQHDIYVVSSTPGEADFTSITAALKQAKEASQIVIRPGTYQEQLVLDKNIEIIGAGPRDQIILQTDAGSIFSMTATHVKIQGLTLNHQTLEPESPSSRIYRDLDTNRTSQSRKVRPLRGARGGIAVHQGQLKLVDCTLESKTQAITISGTNSQVILSNCLIHGGKTSGITLDNGGQAVLEQCVITECQQTGIQVCNKGSSVTMNNCRIDHGKGVGLSLAPGAQATLENCHIFSNLGSGIQILGEHSTATLTQCRIYDGEEKGISVWQKGQLTAENCDIYSNLHAGIFLSDKESVATLTNCQIHDGKYTGIEIVEQGSITLDGCGLNANAGSALRICGEGSLAKVNKSTFQQNKYTGITLQEKGQGEFTAVSLMRNGGPGIRISHAGSKATLKACIIGGNGVGVLIEQQGESIAHDCQIEKNRSNIYIEPGSKMQALYLDKETNQLVARGGSNNHDQEIWQQIPKPVDTRCY
jgi:molecular chaperone DnaK (HSP70)